MAIHQIQVRYDAQADRLLIQVRTTQSELYAIWLTRRMTARLYPPYRQSVTRVGVAKAAPQSLPVPEARAMLEQAALQRPLPGTDFDKPFTDARADPATSHPLGPEPLLPGAIDLRPQPGGGLAITVREERGRRLEMTLTADLSTALLRLMDTALKAADWNLPPAEPAPAAATEAPPSAEPAPGRLLN